LSSTYSTPSPTPIQTPIPTPIPTNTPTPTPTPTGRINVALTNNGGIATASSQISEAYSPNLAINGARTWANGGGWKDATPDVYPDILQVDFSGSKTINEIDVYTVTDDFSSPAEPTENTTFSTYGITSFDVQYWNGSNWVTVQNGSITNTNKVLTKLVFPAITTTKIRVVINNAQTNYSRIVELEAWTGIESSTPTPTPVSTTTTTPTPVSTPTITPTPNVTPTPIARTNVALTANGAIATASSQLSGGSPDIAIDGIRNWATSGAWKDATPDSYPDVLQVDFNDSKTINEIDVYAVKDDFSNPSDPAENATFSIYGITNFNVQYWNGSNWITVQNGNIVNNNKVITKLVFSAVTTTKIRVVVNNAHANYSRIVELEAWSNSGNVTPSPTPTTTIAPTPVSTVTPTPTPTMGTRTNVALTTNGGIASASSSLANGSPDVAIDGIRNWATSGAWKDATPDVYPDVLQVDFSGSKTINEIDVYAVKDDFSNPSDPNERSTFSIYGITNFDVQYWNGSSWMTVPNGNIVNNNKVVTKLVFPAITTTKIRVVVNNAQTNYSRIVELEAWSLVNSQEMQTSVLNIHNTENNILAFIETKMSLFDFLKGSLEFNQVQ
jgi:hypothetical protein